MLANCFSLEYKHQNNINSGKKLNVMQIFPNFVSSAGRLRERSLCVYILYDKQCNLFGGQLSLLMGDVFVVV